MNNTMKESHVRFDLLSQREEMLAYLEEHGYAVIQQVATQQEVEQGKHLLWKLLGNFPDNAVHWEDPSTWGHEEWAPSPRNGILNGMGTGQSALAWQARLFPLVKETFASVWKTDELITSFDGVNVFRPWKEKKEWRTTGGWWHVDQNGYFEDRRGRVCVQGLVSYTAASSVTGGLCVLAGSHKQHTDMCLRNKLAYLEGDFLKVPPEDEVFQNSIFEKRLVCCEAGDMIIWDSRLVHCNTPGKDEECHQQSVTSLLRLCAYVCMTPLSWASPEVLSSRRAAFIHNESTTHWPHAFISAGGKACAHYLPKNNLSVLENDASSDSFEDGISLQHRLLIDGNTLDDSQSYFLGLYQYVEESVAGLCSIS